MDNGYKNKSELVTLTVFKYLINFKINLIKIKKRLKGCFNPYLPGFMAASI